MELKSYAQENGRNWTIIRTWKGQDVIDLQITAVKRRKVPNLKKIIT